MTPTREQRRQLERDNQKYPLTLVQIPKEEWPLPSSRISEVWRSREFLVQIPVPPLGGGWAGRTEFTGDEMSKVDDGGSAFPKPGFYFDEPAGERRKYLPENGMSLRDWFAGQALADCMGFHGGAKEAAKAAYEIADALLAHRTKGRE